MHAVYYCTLRFSKPLDVVECSSLAQCHHYDTFAVDFISKLLFISRGDPCRVYVFREHDNMISFSMKQTFKFLSHIDSHTTKDSPLFRNGSVMLSYGDIGTPRTDISSSFNFFRISKRTTSRPPPSHSLRHTTMVEATKPYKMVLRSVRGPFCFLFSCEMRDCPHLSI